MAENKKFYDEKGNEIVISASDFEFAQTDKKIHDTKFESVPTTFIKDAFKRFCKNKSSVVAAFIIGILVLVGIVVNNGIVLVDYINQKKAEGLASYEAIVVGSQDRVRPILMTALTTILGLIPLAMGLGEGTELNQPMAIVVIGGLLTSTILTLFIVPIIYSLLDSQTRKMQ